ncbi:MAG TPA: hypothetical protein VEB64_10740 [Azospirillaceae bacterium]|nr:hypothetical protein [Azospirillaceae bacterium]
MAEARKVPHKPDELEKQGVPDPKTNDQEDPTRTPGDGTLQDAVPAGLTVEELRRRAEEAGNEGSQPGSS